MSNHFEIMIIIGSINFVSLFKQMSHDLFISFVMVLFSFSEFCYTSSLLQEKYQFYLLLSLL